MIGKSMLAVLALSLCAAAGAEELFTLNEPETWRSAKDFVKTEEGGLQISRAAMLHSKPSFQVNPKKKYKLTMKVRRAPGSPPSQFYAVFLPATDEGATIRMNQVTAIAKSEGTLVAEVKKGFTALQVKPENPRYWSPGSGRVVCFNAADDMSDLPNTSLSSGIAKVEIKDGIAEVTLRSPMAFDVPEGTKVRIHAGGSYIYVIQAAPAPENWTEYSGEVSGIAPGWSNKHFPVGTASAAVSIMANWNVKAGTTQVEIKDVKVEELD